jgi:acetyl esterase/lipase
MPVSCPGRIVNFFSCHQPLVYPALSAELQAAPPRRWHFKFGPGLTDKTIRADCKRTLLAVNASWAATFSIGWRFYSVVLLVKLSSIRDEGCGKAQPF